MFALRIPFRLSLLVRTLHLGMAGIFAFVLPFVCWGAMATPGHAHAGPHFVFAAPPETRPQLPAKMTLAELIAWNQSSNLCGEPAHAVEHPTSDPVSGAPIGQSVPRVLIGSLLLLMTVLAAQWLLPKERPEFSIMLGAPAGKRRSLPPIVPPPRIFFASLSLSPV
jgi:hypothetical protein